VHLLRKRGIRVIAEHDEHVHIRQRRRVASNSDIRGNPWENQALTAKPRRALRYAFFDGARGWLDNENSGGGETGRTPLPGHGFSQ
jgi:hypothetical protein